MSTPVLSEAVLIEQVALDDKFQAACQRYAQSNGSSHAIAAAAVRALESMRTSGQGNA